MTQSRGCIGPEFPKPPGLAAKNILMGTAGFSPGVGISS